MPDRETTSFTRVCPSCGRRVPQHVAKCRCGAALPETDAPVAEKRSSRSPVVALIGPALFAIAALVAWVKWGPEPEDMLNHPGFHRGAPPPANRNEFLDPISFGPPPKRPANTTPAETVAAPPPAAASNPSPAIDEMVARVMPAVVQVQTTTMTGSAFFVAYDTLITNVHVVKDDAYVELKRGDGTTATAAVVNRAANYDLAVLKVSQPVSTQPFIRLSGRDTVREGQEVVSIGSALGTLHNSVTRGVVSGLRNAGGVIMIQHDAAMSPGDSGGPLLDRDGRAIGVNTMTYTDKPGISFSIAADYVSDLVAGRLTDAGTTGRGLQDIEASGRQSESDLQVQRGDKELRGRIEQARKTADAIDANWRRYREQCFKGNITGRFDREWFAMVTPGAMPPNAALGCESGYEALMSDITRFREGVRITLAAARRANLQPGTIRDVLRENRLEFDWDR